MGKTNAEHCKNYYNRKKAAKEAEKIRQGFSVEKPIKKTGAERTRAYRLRKIMLSQANESSVTDISSITSTSNSRIRTFEPSFQLATTIVSTNRPDVSTVSSTGIADHDGGKQIDVVRMSMKQRFKISNTKKRKKWDISSNFISNKNEAAIKKEKVERVAWLNPSVLTTRLDDMCIFQKPLIYGKPRTIIDKIYLESIAAVLAKKTSDYKYECRCPKKIKRNHNVNLEILYEKLKRKLGSKTKFESTNENVIEVKKQSVTIVDSSSDDDENLLTYKVKRSKVENTNNILYNYLFNHKEEHTDLLPNNLEENKIDDSLKVNRINYTDLVNNLNKFGDLRILKKITGTDFMPVIVLNNVYSQTTDIYVTDIKNNIFEFVTIPIEHYSLFNKLLSIYNMKQKNKPTFRLLWIDCCCWVQRQNEIKRLCPRKIANSLFSSHTCHLICSCCCNEEKSKPTPEPTIDCDTEVYSPKENLDIAIKEKTICNPLIQLALNFNKPKSNRILNTKLNKQHRDKNPSSIQFVFKTATKKDKHVESKVSGSKSNTKTEEALSNNQLEFVQLDSRRELLGHSFIMTPKKASMLRVNTFEGHDVCCEAKFKCLIRMLCVRYNIGPTVIKYIEGIHKCNIYRTYINRPDKCTQCKDIKVHDDKRGPVKYDFKVSAAPIEHTRKVIKGQIVQDKKVETIQEIMEKVKKRFPNMSYFINDQGLPTASLPMPFHSYPIEDIKYLTQVMEFAHSELIKQKKLLSGSLNQGKSGNEIICDLTKNLELQPSKATQTNSKQVIKTYERSKLPTIKVANTHDLCTSLMKRNKELYTKSFRSFVNNFVDPNKMPLEEEENLPKIVDVYSLTDNEEIPGRLHYTD